MCLIDGHQWGEVCNLKHQRLTCLFCGHILFCFFFLRRLKTGDIIWYNRRQAERSVSLVRLIPFDWPWTAFKQKIKKNGSHAGMPYEPWPQTVNPTGASRLLFCFYELFRFIEREEAKTLPQYVLKRGYCTSPQSSAQKYNLFINKEKKSKIF